MVKEIHSNGYVRVYSCIISLYYIAYRYEDISFILLFMDDIDLNYLIVFLNFFHCVHSMTLYLIRYTDKDSFLVLHSILIIITHIE